MAGMPTCIRSRCPAMALRMLMRPLRGLTHILQGSMVARACIAYVVLLVASVVFPVRFSRAPRVLRRQHEGQDAGREQGGE